MVSAIARDAAGNQTTQFLEVTVDNTPPTISLIAPTAGSVVSGNAVTIAASAFDNIAVAGVQFQSDGINVGFAAGRANVAASANGASVSASSTLNSQFPVSAVIDGDRNGTAWGNGGGWNDATPGSFPDYVEIAFSSTKTIDEVDVFTLQDDFANAVNPIPGQTFTKYGITTFEVRYWNGESWALIPGASVSGNQQVWRQIKFAPVSTPRIRVIVTGAVDDWSRIIEIEAYSAALPAGNAPPCSRVWDTTTVVDGIHALTAIARDEAGNSQTSSVASVFVSNGSGGALSSSFFKRSPVNAASDLSRSATLNWAASNGATSYEYCVDTTNNNSCDTGWTSTAGTSVGIGGLNSSTTYYWQVRARNAAGAIEADNGKWWNFTTLQVNSVNVAAAVNGALARHLK